jgi:hypothetical protein
MWPYLLIFASAKHLVWGGWCVPDPVLRIVEGSAGSQEPGPPAGGSNFTRGDE